MSASQKYPRISDMVMPAARRLPAFVHAYLAAGTGQGQLWRAMKLLMQIFI